MTTIQQYPFNLVNAFFVSLEFEREPVLPEKMELPIEAQIKVVDEGFPRLQVNLRTRTQGQASVKFSLELVGLFDYAGDHPEIDREIAGEFVREKGLYMLWPYVTQTIRIITGQMGMNPLDTKTPLYFSIAAEPLSHPVEESKPKGRRARKVRA